MRGTRAEMVGWLSRVSINGAINRYWDRACITYDGDLAGGHGLLGAFE